MKSLASRIAYQTLIVEDEPIFVDQLTGYMAQVDYLTPPLVCGTSIEALQVLATSSIDLLFLDLSLPDIQGIDVLKTSSPLPAVIITSAHRELAVDYYDLDVIDFLAKPYDFNRFLRSLRRMMQRTRPVPTTPDDKSSVPEKEQIYFKSGRRLERFNYNDIQYMEAYGLYTKVHTAEGIFAVNKRISVLIAELPPERFVRIHKSYIINIDHLKRLESKQVWIKATRLPIGVTYHPKVHQAMQQLGISASEK